ncbi:MAG: MarR family transcriptional regulator, partial [Gammaproteobacteria bacterium]|nr:MarR family transcriptional regulator [Gammaproteobacteria bacterium]
MPHDRPLGPASVEGQSHPSLGALLHDVARLRRAAFDVAAKPLGITRSQFRLLSYLAAAPGKAQNQTAIAHGVAIGKVTVGGLVDRLESAGFVQRMASPDDRRVKLITLTFRGRRALQNARRLQPQLDACILRGLDAR